MAQAESPRIDDEALAHLERLARLQVPAEEREAIKADLASVLAFVAQLSEMQAEGAEVPPSAAGAGEPRPDVPRPGLGQEAALSVAPSARDGYFEVPRTVDEG